MQADRQTEEKHTQELQGLRQRLQSAQSSHEQLQKVCLPLDSDPNFH